MTALMKDFVVLFEMSIFDLAHILTFIIQMQRVGLWRRKGLTKDEGVGRLTRETEDFLCVTSQEMLCQKKRNLHRISSAAHPSLLV